MPSTLDSNPNPGVFALFKGEPNSGKSTCALSFPGAYVFDFDRKMPTIAMKHFRNQEIHWDTFDSIFPVSDKLKEFQVSCPYETIIVDSVTSLSTLVLNSIGDVKGENVMSMLQRAKDTKLKPGEVNKKVEVMGIDYYNAESNFFERYFLDVLKLLWAKPGYPNNVIVLAHIIKYDSSPDLKTKVVTTTKTLVTAGKKVAAFILSRFDEDYTFVLESEPFTNTGTKRICQTVPLDDNQSRNAINLPEKIDFTNNPNFYSIYKEFLK